MIALKTTPAWLEQEASKLEAEAAAMSAVHDGLDATALYADAAALRMRTWQQRRAMRRRAMLRVVAGQPV